MSEQEKQQQTGRSNFINYMSNPKSFTLKKWFAELLKGDYPKHDQIIERVATSITTDKDLKEFGALVINIYETAYHKAVNDYKDQAEKLGIKISIVSEETTSSPSSPSS